MNWISAKDRLPDTARLTGAAISRVRVEAAVFEKAGCDGGTVYDLRKLADSEIVEETDVIWCESIGTETPLDCDSPYIGMTAKEAAEKCGVNSIMRHISIT